MSILDVLSRQFNAAWDMLSDGAMKCPESDWKKPGSDPFFTPVRLVYHCIQTVDFYTSDRRDDFDWKAGGFDADEASEDEFPDRPAVREYCHRVREQVDDWLEKHGPDGILGADEEFSPWFPTRLDRAIYALRHTQHHTGQLSLELQNRGFEEVNWG